MTVHAFSKDASLDANRDPFTHVIPGAIDRELVLASTSASLRRLLEASGLSVRVAPPDHEEMNALREVLRSTPEPDPADVAELHVRMRIDGAAAQFPGALVIGAQQIVSLDGKLREAPRTLNSARDLLLELRGRTHQLHLAIALAEEGQITWSSVETAHVTMRPVSAEFVGRYLVAAGPQALGSPGAYELDGVGLQLLDRIEGAFPSILGAPLFPLFSRLREIGFLAT
jgi:septum formation protein